nr:AraC family transcriptional regulator [uncultured Flavobacterium sp.]
MITNLLFIITGIIGLLTAFLIFNNHKSNRMMNSYMILLIIIISIRFLLGGLIYFNSDRIVNQNYLKYRNLTGIVIPLVYLYFKNLAANKNQFKIKELAHFILPISLCFAIVILDKILPKSIRLDFIIFPFFCIYTITYFILSYRVLKNEIWNRKGSLNVVQKQNELINNWTAYLFIAILILAVRLLVALFIEIYHNSDINGFSYLWISAIVWLVVLIKILITPEILYGYDALNFKIKEINDSSLILKDIWKLTNTSKLENNQHLVLKEKIDRKILVYIEKIEKLALSYEIFRDPELSLADFSNQLGIPKSHVSYLFKYHTTISFSEFKKTIRVHDAIKHIESDFLKTNTLDSLSKKVGFTSYNPFFTSFKEVSGVSPIEYYKMIQLEYVA